MNNHSKSLFFSLAIHVLLLASLFGIHNYIFPLNSVEQKEKRVCVNLAYIKPKEAQKQNHNIQKEQANISKKYPTCKNTQKKQKKTPQKKRKKEKLQITQQAQVVTKSIQKPIEPSVEKIAKEQTKKKVVQTTATSQKKIIHVTNSEKTLSEPEVYIQNNLAKITDLIRENLYYPRIARKRGIEGDVTVRFMLHKDATVTQITTISSNSGILTRAAIKTIAELSGKFPKPKTDIMLSVPIKYSLY